MKNIGKGLTLGIVAHLAMGCGLLLSLDAYSPSTCDDGVQGGDEMGVDCGGVCAPCALDNRCTDGVRNGTETDVDCGGQCAGKCNVDQGCVVGTDCASLVCGAGTCLPPTCDDKKKNGDETDRDCGGGCPIACKEGQGCTRGDDCESLVCEMSSCLSNHVWSQSFSKSSTAYPAVVVDSSGNTLIAGEFKGALDLGNGPLKSAGEEDIFVAKLSEAGVSLWSKRFGDVHSDGMGALAASGGDLLITGAFQGTINFGNDSLVSKGGDDIYIAKFGASGDLLWSRRFGDVSNQYGNAVASDSEGNVFIAGSFEGTLDFGDGPLTSAGNVDGFVAKLDPEGNLLWSRSFGDSESQEVNGAAVDSKGDVALIGAFEGTMSFDGEAPLVDAGFGDVFVAKLSKYGAPIWSKRFGDGWEPQNGVWIQVDAKDNMLAAGVFAGTFDANDGTPLKSAGSGDIFAVKLSSAGDSLWSKGIGNAMVVEFPPFVSVRPAGNVLLGGPMRGTLDVGGEPLVASGKEDFFLVEYDAAGNHLWSRRFGDATDSLSLTGVAWSNTTGDALITGYFDGTLDLGGAPLTSGPDGSLFLSKLRLP